MNMPCIFCTSENVKKRTIASNDTAFAFLTNIPITPSHTLVCPKRCVAKIDDLDYYELKDLYELVLKIKDALVKTYDAEGFNCAWNEGLAGGQNIEHLHVHIVPRKKGDTGILQYDPREFLYRPGPRVETNEEKLQEITKEIKANVAP